MHIPVVLYWRTVLSKVLEKNKVWLHLQRSVMYFDRCASSTCEVFSSTWPTNGGRKFKTVDRRWKDCQSNEEFTVHDHPSAQETDPQVKQSGERWGAWRIEEGNLNSTNKWWHPEWNDIHYDAGVCKHDNRRHWMVPHWAWFKYYSVPEMWVCWDSVESERYDPIWSSAAAAEWRH